ncbi:hypothetical protein DQ04_00531080 [Trypanosoma grayi]|uniref:hypothetical protein n=1 Tax=Trypanosoma grayi TaxID=71804 RepID=UPI0004F47AC6|nr:hypothetical protein DQ04_00531080 [Trypanosoma grayi]KEG14303.1 hypothetical protein DQ04_00531080 [Trypanosoma grayi]
MEERQLETMPSRSVARGAESLDPRHFGTSTDDTAIYLEDSMDEPTARCISASPSAVAILSPQRMPPSNCHAVDITEYDSTNIGSACGAKSHRIRPLSDLTNTGSVYLPFAKSPTPRRSMSSSAQCKRASSSTPSSSQKHQHSQGHHQQRHHGSSSVSVGRCVDSTFQGEQTVHLAEYEKLQRERNRFEKMYEHQKTLYEEMAERQSDTYKELQEKIIEVVALSTRNEENKRFIRQLKREMADSRTRVMNIQNRALEETKMEKSARERYQTQLHEHQEKYSAIMEQQEAKVAGLESLLKDITCMKGECDHVQVSQLDALLKAAYAKNTALFGDLLRQGRQIDMLFDSKASLEKQLEQLRREKRETEATWAGERRRMLEETERYTAQLAEQQHSVLELRQMLIRTLESATLTQRDRSENEDDDDETDSSSYSSESSSQGGRELDDDNDNDDDDDDDDDNNDDGSAEQHASSTPAPERAIVRVTNRDGAVSQAERRTTDLAALSAQIQAKLRALPAGRI